MGAVKKGLGTIGVAALVAWALLEPASGAWAFAASEFAFLAWLARQMRASDAAALRGRAREPLDADESEVVERYPAYFGRPAFAGECAATLAALGLASLLVVPWLTYKQQWAPAIMAGVMLFRVGRLTRLLSPVYALRLAIAKGDRDALRLLSAHDGAMRKLSAHHAPEPEQAGAAGR
jgi:hypothetical protein